MRQITVRRTTSRRTTQDGFSLIELMVVITIIGLLGGIVGVNVMRHLRRANVQATKSQLILIDDAIAAYKMETRRLPDSLSDLVGEDGFLRTDEVPTDAWGNDFIYEPQGRREFLLYSLGADNLEGGDAEDADIDRDSARKFGREEEDAN